LAATIDVSMLDGLNGFTLTAAPGADAGLTVSDAGDVNGDGIDDLITGEGFVVFGKLDGYGAKLDLQRLDGRNGFKLSGIAPHDAYIVVSAAGDINNDGFDDVIIGAPGATSDIGTSYLVFGASVFEKNLNVSTLNGINGFKLVGAAPGDYLGRSVSSAGDINNDGFDDIILGAWGADSNGSGSRASYVVFGKAGGFAAVLDIATLDGTNGFKISGVAAGAGFGRSVSSAGDVNNDGFDDIVIGAWTADFERGASYVVFGKAGVFAASFDLSTLNGSNGFKLSGGSADRSGCSVSVAGDINGDGFSDVIIGAYKPHAYGPGAYVVFGRANGFPSNVDLSTLDGSNGFRLSGVGERDNTGRSVSGVGDFNGDGFSDFIVAAPAPQNRDIYAASYVVFGKPGGFAPNMSLSTLDGSNGFKVSGAGFWVSGAGDINRDGLDDVIIGNFSGTPDVIFGCAVEVSINDAVVIEGNEGQIDLQFVVSLSQAAIVPVTMKVATADGTAHSGSDYAQISDVDLTFAPGEVSKTVTINVIGDLIYENDETLFVVLSDPSSGTLKDALGVGKIENDDALPSLSIADASIVEGDAGTRSLSLTVSLSATSELPATVHYTTVDGTALAGNDYRGLATGELTFLSGETEKTITVDVTGDTNIEDHETFNVVLSQANGATIANDTAVGTILNDDAAVRISDAALIEGHSGVRSMTFTVSMTAASALPVTLNVASVDGTAIAGVDYVALAPHELAFAPGETSKSITVDVRGDVSVESAETFSVVLSDPINATIDDGMGVGTIFDDDVRLVGPHNATFTDVAGDRVVIKVSRGKLKVENFTIVPSGLGAQLALVDFSNKQEFAGANVKIMTKRADGAQGSLRSVDVGAFDASGIDLGKVTIRGDLGQIDVGTGDESKPALVKLRAHSLGGRGLITQLPGGSLNSDILGGLGILHLTGDMRDAWLSVSGNIASLTINGDLFAGGILSHGRIGAIKIGGNLGGSASDAAIISGLGTVVPSSDAKTVAISSLSIGGSVSHAEILAGYDRIGVPRNAAAGIGRVTVDGNWTASNLIAGATAGLDNLFGTDDDTSISDSLSVVSEIASIVIRGTAAGTEGGNDHFGFVAQKIGVFEVDNLKIALTHGASNDLMGLSIATSGDLTLREVA